MTNSPVPAGTAPSPPAGPAPDSTQQQIRGSSLLLVGRVLAQVLDLGGQALLVRYLSKTDYGAFGYALALVVLCKGIAVFGLPNTLGRFVPLYRERREHNALLGTVVLALATVLVLGVLLAAVLPGLLPGLGLAPPSDPQALALLAVLALLIPVEALDDLLTALFATFASPRLIFFRQSVLGPGLRFGLVVVLIAVHASVLFLAAGYLCVSIIGMLAYGVMFVRLLHGQGLLRDRSPRDLAYPARDIFGFAVPMLAATLVGVVMESADAVLLGHFQNTAAVASFRAVLPVASLSQGVLLTFGLLYTPLAARLYARGERGPLADLYWQTALWMTILTFPLFLLTFSFAPALTVGLFGPKYADSASIMALLSFGYFFNTALGFNGLTLKIGNKLHYSVAIDIAAAVVNVAINLLLIPGWGALGAAIGTTGTLIVHNALKQYGLWKYTGISLMQPRYLLTYGALLGLALGCLIVQAALPASLLIALPMAGLLSLGVLWSTRSLLRIDTMFPELLRWPLVRLLLRPAGGRS